MITCILKSLLQFIREIPQVVPNLMSSHVWSRVTPRLSIGAKGLARPDLQYHDGKYKGNQLRSNNPGHFSKGGLATTLDTFWTLFKGSCDHFRSK